MDSPSSPRPGITQLRAWAVSRSGSQDRLRVVPDEVPLALVYNGHSQAVMMTTPADIEDFAVGFSLTEQIVESAAQISDIRYEVTAKGIRVDLQVPAAIADRLREERNRSLVGRTGCGVCGVDTLEQIERKLQPVARDARVNFTCVQEALSALSAQQLLNAEAHAIHAAALANREGRLLAVREDVGRHNALDKLIGAVAREGIQGSDGFCLITSRCSYEMVQKAAIAGFQILVAISAPTAPAVRIAEETGMTLIALARPDNMLVFAGAERVLDHEAGGSGLVRAG
jgi:FdhD protein